METAAKPQDKVQEWQLSDMEFCGYVCMAARRANIPIAYQEAQGKHLYIFVDLPAFGTVIRGEPQDNKQKALKSACVALVRYFTER